MFLSFFIGVIVGTVSGVGLVIFLSSGNSEGR